MCFSSFLNVIPDYAKNEGTYDLIRKTDDAPNGIIDFMMVALAVGAVFVLVQAQPYRMARLITFTDPWSDQFGSGYQLTKRTIWSRARAACIRANSAVTA